MVYNSIKLSPGNKLDKRLKFYVLDDKISVWPILALVGIYLHFISKFYFGEVGLKAFLGALALGTSVAGINKFLANPDRKIRVFGRKFSRNDRIDTVRWVT